MLLLLYFPSRLCPSVDRDILLILFFNASFLSPQQTSEKTKPLIVLYPIVMVREREAYANALKCHGNMEARICRNYMKAVRTSI